MPDDFRRTAIDHYLPLVSRVQHQKESDGLSLVGINGAQGSGKSTLARFMQQVMAALWDWNVVVLSIDDFYLTQAERSDLGESVHPLFATRGVPGTHDIELLIRCLDALQQATGETSVSIPRFDKSHDDRWPESEWTIAKGPIDLVILEGWCVGSRPQRSVDLQQPVNALEGTDDTFGIWRRSVNERLMNEYAALFTRLDFLAFLQVPDFDCVYRWRAEQEEKLAASGTGDAVMDDEKLRAFLQYFERLTRHNLKVMPELADAVLELDRDHQCHASYYR